MTEYKKNEAIRNQALFSSTDIQNVYKSVTESPIAKAIVYIGFGLAAIYLGKVIMNQAADSIRAYKNLRSACQNQ